MKHPIPVSLMGLDPFQSPRWFGPDAAWQRGTVIAMPSHISYQLILPWNFGEFHNFCYVLVIISFWHEYKGMLCTFCSYVMPLVDQRLFRKNVEWNHRLKICKWLCPYGNWICCGRGMHFPKLCKCIFVTIREYGIVGPAYDINLPHKFWLLLYYLHVIFLNLEISKYIF